MLAVVLLFVLCVLGCVVSAPRPFAKPSRKPSARPTSFPTVSHTVKMQEKAALLKFFGDFKCRINWDFEGYPCDDSAWATVDCKSGRVSKIVLRNFNSSNPLIIPGCVSAIPPSIKELTALSELNSIYLNNLGLNGMIPEGIGLLTTLAVLDVSSNQITGLPNSLSNCANLISLIVNDNNISAVPEVLTKLSISLKILLIARNAMHGTLPSAISKYTNLELFSLHFNQFYGPFPESIGDLVNLRALNASYNNFSGQVPPLLLSKLNILQYLNLRHNSFTGKLDDNFFPSLYESNNQLRYLDLSQNQFSNTIPSSLSNLIELEYLFLSENNFDSTIPSIPNGSLRCLNVSHNKLAGPYPAFLSDFYTIKYADLSSNKFTGNLPSLSNHNDSEMFNSEMIGLKFLILDDNLFSGSLSSNIFTNVTNTLERFSAKNNKLEGEFPSLDLAKLEALDLSNNHLISSQFVLSGLPALQRLNFSGNPNLRGEISSDLCSLIKLSSIDLSSIHLKGIIPSCIGNLLDLQELILTDCTLSGTLPSELSKLSNLQQLMLKGNNLKGALPSSLGQLHGLTFLSVKGNEFSSTIPQELGGLRSIDFLDLSDNYFEYGLGLEFINSTNMPNLSYFDCSRNIFAGSVPSSLWNISSLETVVMTSNCMEGSLPDTICLARSLKNLILDGLSAGDDTYHLCSANIWSIFYRETFHFDALRGQKMEGSIPFCVFSLPSLEKLHLSGNQFSGSIDPELKSWPSNLTELVLANNKLVGTISDHLQEQFGQLERLDLRRNKFNGTLYGLQLPQTYIDLSVNRFSGQLPPSVLDIPPALDSLRLLEGNAFSCDLTRSDLPTSDPAYSYYKCGSDLTNAVIYVAVSLLVVVLPYTYFLHNKKAVSKQETLDFSKLENIKLFVKKADDMMKALAILGLVFVFVLIPVYAAATVLYSSRSFSYIWSVSGALKTGVPAATLLLFCFSGVTITAFGLLFRYQSFRGEVKTLRGNKDEKNKSDDTNPSDKIDFGKAVFLLFTRIFLTFFLTFVTALSVNVTYVQKVPILSSSQIFFAQIGMAVFKSVLTFTVSKFLNHPYSYFGYNSVFMHQAVKNNYYASMLIDSHITFVFLEIFIRIIIPCGASAYADSNCFKEYFYKQNPVDSSYGDSMQFKTFTVAPWIYFNLDSDIMERGFTLGAERLNFALSIVQESWNYEVPVSSSVSFIPPFQYMYVCSSRILEVYAPVVATSVVIRFLHIIFNGIVLFALKYFRPKDESQIDSKHQLHGMYRLLLCCISRTDWTAIERRTIIAHYTAELKTEDEAVDKNERLSLCWKFSRDYKDKYNKNQKSEYKHQGIEQKADLLELGTSDVGTENEVEKRKQNEFEKRHEEELKIHREAVSRIKYTVAMIFDLSLLLTFGLVCAPIGVMLVISLLVKIRDIKLRIIHFTDNLKNDIIHLTADLKNDTRKSDLKNDTRKSDLKNDTRKSKVSELELKMLNDEVIGEEEKDGTNIFRSRWLLVSVSAFFQAYFLYDTAGDEISSKAAKLFPAMHIVVVFLGSFLVEVIMRRFHEQCLEGQSRKEADAGLLHENYDDKSSGIDSMSPLHSPQTTNAAAVATLSGSGKQSTATTRVSLSSPADTHTPPPIPPQSRRPSDIEQNQYQEAVRRNSNNHSSGLGSGKLTSASETRLSMSMPGELGELLSMPIPPVPPTKRPSISEQNQYQDASTRYSNSSISNSSSSGSGKLITTRMSISMVELPPLDTRRPSASDQIQYPDAAWRNSNSNSNSNSNGNGSGKLNSTRLSISTGSPPLDPTRRPSTGKVLEL